MTELYQRNVNTWVDRLDDRTIAVTAALLDLDHSMRVRLTVNAADRQIVDAEGEMIKIPFDICQRALDNLEQLKGLAIERGVAKKVSALVGKRTGCTHLVEVVMSAVRLAGVFILGFGAGLMDHDSLDDLNEEEKRQLGMLFLKDSCLAYKSDDGAEGLPPTYGTAMFRNARQAEGTP